MFEAHAVMKYYRKSMYIIPMNVSHCVIVQLDFEVAKFKLTAIITSNSTFFHYVCLPFPPERASMFDGAKIRIIFNMTRKKIASA